MRRAVTIIAYKDGVMCADSESNGGGLRYPIKVPKIARGNGLAGAAGMSSDCASFLLWFAAGERPHERPVFTGTGDDEMQVLIARPDGTLWRVGAKELPFEISQPYAIGGGNAWAFCEGAMLAGKSCQKAVKLTLKHFSTVGGKVQVEKLNP